MKEYIIISKKTDKQGNKYYYNVLTGWNKDRTRATIFKAREKAVIILPKDGYWKRYRRRII